MLRLEEDAVGRVRVIGRLCGQSAQKMLREALARGAVIVDTSGVLQADEEAVAFLAGLPTESTVIVSPPAWLARWIERVREVDEETESRSIPS